MRSVLASYSAYTMKSKPEAANWRSPYSILQRTDSGIDMGEEEPQQPVLERTSRISGVIHFAAYKSVEESIRQPLRYYSNNVCGLVDFLDLLEQFGIKNFVFSSSAPSVLTSRHLDLVKFQTSPEQSSRVRSALHMSSVSARWTSATQKPTSPALRPTSRAGIVRCDACSRLDNTSRTVWPRPVPGENQQGPG
jgi:hypothetical protein